MRKRVMKITWHEFTILLDIDRLRKEISNNCKLQKVHQCYLTSLIITYSLSMEVYVFKVYEFKAFFWIIYIYYCTFLLFTLSLSKSLSRMHFVKEKMDSVTLEEHLRCNNFKCNTVGVRALKSNLQIFS